MKKIVILGSTGSIGTQTLDIVSKNEDLQVVGISAGQNISMLEEMCIRDRVNDIWDCAYIMKQGEIVREIHRGEEGSETLKQIFFETTAEGKA